MVLVFRSAALPTVTLLGILGIAAGCSQITEVSDSELAAVVSRDGIAYDGPTIPEIVLDGLASFRLVIIGETHFLEEHRDFVATLVRELHSRGFRQLLVEFPQMADWILEDYVSGGRLEPEWEPPAALGLAMFSAIREFNSTLPEPDRVHVRSIDVNLGDYGGARDFRQLLQRISRHLDEQGPIAPFLQEGYGTPEEQVSSLERIRERLIADRALLASAWGPRWYETVAEMVEVELASVSIRGMRQDRYDLSVRLRESVMKRIADLRLEECEHGTLINVGGNHAQKAYLKGTDQQWLGDYLVHESSAVGGASIVLNVGAARIVSSPAASTTFFDIRDASPHDELWRLMSEIWPDKVVYLPLDDPIFSVRGVRLNYEGVIHVAAPKRHYDALLLLPLAHRVPLR